MSTAVERAAAALETRWVSKSHPGHWVNAPLEVVIDELRREGIIPDGESQTRVEYEVRYSKSVDGEILGGGAPTADDARTKAAHLLQDRRARDLLGEVEAVVKRTVTTHRSEWQEVGDA